MVDSNIFTRLLDGEAALLVALRQHTLVATHVQHDELLQTRDPGRRSELLHVFIETAPRLDPTESAVWGISKWGQAKWGDSSRFAALLARLRHLDGRDRGLNQLRDVLIAETSIVNHHTLLTDDRNLATVTQEFGGATARLQDLP
jgi:predicted nucleic acid-binding protein